MKTNSTPTIRDLYPHLTEKELAEAEDNIERYLELVLHIFEHMDSEMGPLSNSHFDGTRRERSGRIKVWAQERTRA